MKCNVLELSCLAGAAQTWVRRHTTIQNTVFDDVTEFRNTDRHGKEKMQ